MDTNLRIYDHLQQFPLFMGLSRAELLSLAGNTKFGFSTISAGHNLCTEGDLCDSLSLLIGGQVSYTTRSSDRSYSMTETLQAPFMLHPESLFGYNSRHPATVVAITKCNLIVLQKAEVLRLLDDFLIIRLNMLNHLSTLVQRRTLRAWRSAPSGLRERIVRFVADHCVYPAGKKELRMLMTCMAVEVGDTRLHVSRVLNDMARSQLIELHRGRIVIPSLEQLLMA